MSDDFLKGQIVKHYAGSHAYGTSTPESDVDFRGIFLADKKFILTPFFNVREVNDPTEEDTKFFELNHFMELCVDANPNILETLWVDDKDIVMRTEMYDHLRSYRDELLSSKIAYTYTGYAHNQATRMKNHHGWMAKEQTGERRLRDIFDKYPCQQVIDWMYDYFPEYVVDRIDTSKGKGLYIKGRIDFDKFLRDSSLQLISTVPLAQHHFVRLVHNYLPEKVLDRDFNLANYNYDHELIHYGDNIFAVVPKKNSKLLAGLGDLLWDSKKERSTEELKVVPSLIVKFNKKEYEELNENRKHYHEWKKNRNVKRSELESLHGYDCYQDSSTEFLTNNGFKKYDDIDEDDLLGTFDENGNLEWQQYTDRIKKPYNGILYTLETENTKSVVTENHRMFISKYSRGKNEHSSYNFYEMKDLPGEFLQLNSIKNIREDNPEYSDAYIALIGAYVSEGSLLKYKNKPKGISLSQLKGGKMEKYFELISSEYKTFLYENSRNDRIELTLNIYNKPLSQKILDLCGEFSKGKKLPKFITELSSRQAKLLLDVMISGDGSERKFSKIYHTSSTSLAEDTYVLATVAGYIAKLWDYKDTHGMYQIYISDKSNADITYKRNHLKMVEVDNEMVVCFTVPNSTLITRNSNKNGFHGNCKHAMHVVRLLRTAEEALTTGQVQVRRPDAEELLAIRNGAWSYEEMMQYFSDKEKYIREVLVKSSPLRKKADVKVAAKVMEDLYEMYWYKK